MFLQTVFTEFKGRGLPSRYLRLQTIADIKLPLAAKLNGADCSLGKQVFRMNSPLRLYCCAIMMSAIGKDYMRRFRERPFYKICENSLLERLETSNLCR